MYITSCSGYKAGGATTEKQIPDNPVTHSASRPPLGYNKAGSSSFTYQEISPRILSRPAEGQPSFTEGNLRRAGLYLQASKHLHQTHSVESRQRKNQTSTQGGDALDLDKNTQKTLKPQRSRMLRHLNQIVTNTGMGIAAGGQSTGKSLSSERNWTFFSMNKENYMTTGAGGPPQQNGVSVKNNSNLDFDMEELFQVEHGLHVKKRPSVQNDMASTSKAILPDIFQQRRDDASSYTKELNDFQSKMSQITDSKILERGSISQETTAQSSKTATIRQSSIKQNKTERVGGSQSRGSAPGVRQLPIKQRPISATRKIINLDSEAGSRPTDSKAKYNMKDSQDPPSLVPARSQTSLLNQTQSTTSEQQTNYELLTKRPPKDNKDTKSTRSYSKGPINAATTLKSKRFSVAAGSSSQAASIKGRETSVNDSSTPQQPTSGSFVVKSASSFDLQVELLKLYYMDKRFIDMALWQSVERTTQARESSQYLAMSIWNHIYQSRLALKPIESIRDMKSEAAFEAFDQICVRNGITNGSKTLVDGKTMLKKDYNKSLIEALRHLRKSQCGKAFTVEVKGNGPKMVLGFEIHKADGSQECSVILYLTDCFFNPASLMTTLEWPLMNEQAQDLSLKMVEYSLGMSPF